MHQGYVFATSALVGSFYSSGFDGFVPKAPPGSERLSLLLRVLLIMLRTRIQIKGLYWQIYLTLEKQHYSTKPSREKSWLNF